MVDPTALPGLIGVTLLFLAPPGPDMAYMLTVGLQGGRRAALQAISGIGTGMAVYAAAAVAGMGRLAQSHPLLFDAVRMIGAAYLVWMAYETARSARRDRGGSAEVAPGRWYRRGVVVGVTNPKIMLFYVAVLPQFLGGAQDVGLQMAMLGAANIATEVVLYGGLGVFAGVLRPRLGRGGRSHAVLHRAVCVVYVALAAVIATDVLLE